MKNLEKKGSSIKIGQILKHFWRGIRPNKGKFFWAYFLYFLSDVVFSIIPLYSKDFFDILDQDNLTRSERGPELLKIVIFIAILHLVVWVFWRTADFLYNLSTNKIAATLKQTALDQVMRHSYSFFANNFTGGITQKIHRFYRAFDMISMTMVYQVLSLFVTIVTSVIVTWFVQPVISIAIMCWIAVFFVFSVLISRWKSKYDVAVADADTKVSGYMSDVVSNNNSVALFTSFIFESLGFKKLAEDHAKKAIKTTYIRDIIDAVMALCITVVEFFVFYFTLKYWQEGLATIGTFVLAQTYIIVLAQQLWGLNRMIRNIYQGFADAKEMVEILETPYEIQDVPNASELKVPKGEIVMKNISFRFSENKEVLKDLNLTIKAGEKVGLVGPSGAGKTTFVRLIMRLYDLTGGAIEIDGQNIHNVTQDSLRANISLVPQDPVLFHRTLMENIRYGRRDATDEEVKEAARLAHCDEFIESLPLKYETFVGERGIKLSGGERQRVAIARAILKKAPILILDEATSSLDSHSELLIQDALDNLMKNCTTIVIAHRLSTIKKMDRIIAMKDGQIVEEGTHDELTNKESGLYKTLWDLQVGGFVA